MAARCQTMRAWWHAYRKQVLLTTVVVAFVLYWAFDIFELTRDEIAHPTVTGDIIMIALLGVTVTAFLALLWIRWHERRKKHQGG